MKMLSAGESETKMKEQLEKLEAEIGLKTIKWQEDISKTRKNNEELLGALESARRRIEELESKKSSWRIILDKILSLWKLPKGV